MNFKFRLTHLRASPLATGLLLAALTAGPLQARPQHYLPAGQPDPLKVLAPPPSPGSPEQAADLEQTVKAYQERSRADEKLGKTEKKISIFSFTPAIGPFFQSGKLPKTEAFFERVQKETEKVADAAKEHWKRPHPYDVEPSLAKGKDTDKSFSYPSGHSTQATVFALLLAELFPDQHENILKIGRDIGWRRVVLGKHYPTDVEAGRVLAQAIVREMKTSAAFQRDFAEAQKEINAVRPTARNQP